MSAFTRAAVTAMLSGLACLGAGMSGPGEKPAAAKLDDERVGEVRRQLETLLRLHVLASYRAFLDGKEPPPPFLAESRLQWEHWRENELSLPATVFDAYVYYVKTINDRDLGAVRIHRRMIGTHPVFIVRVTTDGDSGWLEAFDHNGRPLGAARTYLEFIAWDDQEFVRKQVETSAELPPALRDAPQRTLWRHPATGEIVKASRSDDRAK